MTEKEQLSFDLQNRMTTHNNVRDNFKNVLHLLTDDIFINNPQLESYNINITDTIDYDGHFEILDGDKLLCFNDSFVLHGEFFCNTKLASKYNLNEIKVGFQRILGLFLEEDFISYCGNNAVISFTKFGIHVYPLGE